MILVKKKEKQDRINNCNNVIYHIFGIFFYYVLIILIVLINTLLKNEFTIYLARCYNEVVIIDEEKV